MFQRWHYLARNDICAHVYISTVFSIIWGGRSFSNSLIWITHLSHISVELSIQQWVVQLLSPGFALSSQVSSPTNSNMHMALIQYIHPCTQYIYFIIIRKQRMNFNQKCYLPFCDIINCLFDLWSFKMVVFHHLQAIGCQSLQLKWERNEIMQTSVIKKTSHLFIPLNNT